MNLLRTDYGDGASHPSGMSILGVDTGRTVWVDRDGYRLDFPAVRLAWMRRVVSDPDRDGRVSANGFLWDESQVDSLIREQVTGSLLLTCRDCGTRPIVERVDDRCTECGAAAESRSDEISYTRRLG